MAKEYCVHTAAAARGPFFTKCGFKSKQAAQRFAQRARREGDSARVQPLAGILRDGPAAPTAAAPAPNKPAAAVVAGWWPFGKKTKKLDRDPRRMAQTIMIVPTPSGRMVPLRGARRRRRR